MNNINTFITVSEIKKVLDVSESKAYRIAHTLNRELEEKGFMIIPGRVSRQYFNERFYGIPKLEKKEGGDGNGSL